MHRLGAGSSISWLKHAAFFTSRSSLIDTPKLTDDFLAKLVEEPTTVGCCEPRRRLCAVDAAMERRRSEARRATTDWLLE
jgi:hypothetical protein